MEDVLKQKRELEEFIKDSINKFLEESEADFSHISAEVDYSTGRVTKIHLKCLM